jgi:hypothetical protein
MRRFSWSLSKYDRLPVPVYRVNVRVDRIAARPKFVRALCPFLQNHRFPDETGRTLNRRVRLFLAVVPNNELSQEAAEALCSLCDAFLANPSVEKKTVILYGPARPSQDLIDQLVRSVSRHPGAQLFLRDAANWDAPPAVLLSSLAPSPSASSLESPFSESGIFAVSGMEEGVMTSALTGRLGYPAEEELSIEVTSIGLQAVEVALQKHPEHPLSKLFIWTNHKHLDGTGLLAAALGGRNVRELVFGNFSFLGTKPSGEDEVFVPLEALESPTDGEVLEPLGHLQFQYCSFGLEAVSVATRRPARQLYVTTCHDFLTCDVVLALSTSGLRSLSLRGILLSMSDMERLCSMLKATGCTVEWLALGNHIADEGPSNPLTVSHALNNEVIALFFEELPSMKSLKSLSFMEQVVPMNLSQTILDGFKHNYFLREIQAPTFDSEDQEAKDQLASTCASYARANANGRRTAFYAASNPNDGARQRAAARTIKRLANSNSPDDGTTLLLCLEVLAGTWLAAASRGRQG